MASADDPLMTLSIADVMRLLDWYTVVDENFPEHLEDEDLKLHWRMVELAMPHMVDVIAKEGGGPG